MTHVFIIDIDGTIVGDVCFQIAMFNIFKYLKNLGITPNAKIQDITTCYNPESGLVRPYFADFIKYIRNRYGENVYIFIYTASDHNWALKEVSMIENEHGIKFDRPIFTRKHLKNNKKSINYIKKKIKSVVGKDVSQTRLMIIDNNPDVYMDHREYVVECPDYNFKRFYDLWKIIPPSSLGTKKNPTHILMLAQQYLKCNLLNPICSNIVIKNQSKCDIDKMAKCHEWFYKKLKEISKHNSNYEKDDFWLRLKQKESYQV